MRRGLITVTAAMLAASPVAAADAAGIWRPDVRAAEAYASNRAGEVSFALRTPGRLAGVGVRSTYSSASVVKAMLMVAYLNRRPLRHRALKRRDRALLGPMIRRSSNRAANGVFDIVGTDGLDRLAQRVGMRAFTASVVWGGSQITAADQTKLFLRIDRFVVARHRDYALRLLGSIVARQRWGIARARPRGWTIYFKGGWTSEREHQVALLRRGRHRVALAILTEGSPSAAYGRATQRGIARRLLRGLGPESAPRGSIHAPWT